VAPSPAAFASGLPARPEALLQAAKAELAGGRVANAVAALDRFLELRPEGLDEVFYLYGVALEQNGPTKDIKKAYAWYKKLRDGYPQSQFWDLAAARMSYIERQYFDIR
jgi:outer membrane protein assembly factor BamD (BamD/ComL family)